MYTDANRSYSGLDLATHTRRSIMPRSTSAPHPHERIENFWILLKRRLHGTYVSIQPFHLFRYLDERVFTFNERDLSDLARFTTVLGRVAGRRVTFAELTGKA